MTEMMNKCNKQSAKGMELEFTDLVYRIPMAKGHTKPVLRGVSGRVRSGEMVGVVGPSGSGKSSLMTLLSGHLPYSHEYSGKATLNGGSLGGDFGRSAVGYVQQHDLLLPHQTVRETLEFSANLRLNGSDKEKSARVDYVIEALGLAKIQDSFIGDGLTRGISGGEKKRVSIGLEMIRDVKVLLLDEPTSGLDSFMALSVMETLADLCATKGMAVICVIHQPRSQIWEKFHRFIMLSEGRMVFEGQADQVLPYFEKLGYPCSPNYNPADFVLDLISVDSSDYDKSLARIETFETATKSTRIDASEFVVVDSPEPHPISDEVGYQSLKPFSVQLKHVLARDWREQGRDKDRFIAGLVKTIVFALVIGTVYWGMGLQFKDIQGRTGLLFLLCMNTAFDSLSTKVDVIPTNKERFQRESESGYYGPLAYYASMTLVELPINLATMLLGMVSIYLMSGLRTGNGQLFVFASTLILNSFAADGIALTIGGFSRSPKVAQTIAPLLLMLFIILGGLFVNLDQVPVFLRWVRYLSIVAYSYAAVMINEFEGLDFTCSSGAEGCVYTGEQVLLDFGIDSSLLFNIGMLGVIAVAFRVLGYIALRSSRPKYRQL